MMKRFFRLLTLILLTIFLTSCNLVEFDPNVVSISMREESEKYLDITLGDFDYDNYLFDVTYDDGNTKVVKLTEDMLSSYSRLLINKTGTHEITIKIDKVEFAFSIKVSDKEFEDIYLYPVEYTYTGSPYQISVTGSLPPGTTVLYSNGEYFTDAGEYETIAIVTCEGYTTLTLSSTITIKKATYDLSTMTFEDLTCEYDGYEKILEFTGSLPEGLDYYYTIINNSDIALGETKANSAIDAGIYSVTLHINGDDKNYETDNLTITKKLTINKKLIDMDISSFKFNDKQVVYDGRPHSITIDDTSLPEGIKYTYDNNEFVSAGEYIVTVTFTPVEGDNYQVRDTLSAKLTISKATYDMKNVSFDNIAVTYNGQPHALVITGSLPKGVDVDYYSYEKEKGYEKGYTSVGEYPITVYFKISDDNHESVSPLTATLTINQASFNSFDVTFESSTIVYDELTHQILISGTLPTGMSVEYTDAGGNYYDENSPSIPPKFSEVGEYTIYANFIWYKDNYSSYVAVPESLSANLTITERLIDEENPLTVNDLTFTFDANEHGTHEEIEVPEYITIEKVVILDSENKIVEKCIDSGSYTYYIQVKYYSGKEIKDAESIHAKLTINQLELTKSGGYFSYYDAIEYTYDGLNHPFVLTPSSSIPVLNEFNNSYSYYIVNKQTNETVTEMINAGTYLVHLTFTNSTNYKFTSTDDKLEITCRCVIARQKIDLTDIYPDSSTTVTYDGKTHTPSVPYTPEHVIVNCEVDNINSKYVGTTYWEQYTVWFTADSSNYELVGNQFYQCSVLYEQANLRTNDINFNIEDNGSLLEYSEKSYDVASIKDENGDPIEIGIRFSTSYMQEVKTAANLRYITCKSKITSMTELANDDITITNYYLYVVDENTSKVIYTENYSKFRDISLFYDNGGKFDSIDGTPYGDYYIFIEFASTTDKVRLEKNKVVLHVIVESRTFNENDVFASQTLNYKPNINSKESTYTYDIEKVNIPAGLTILSDSVFTCKYYETNLLKAHINLNKSVYSLETLDITCQLTLEIKDLSIDISGIEIEKNYKIFYNGLDRAKDWISFSDLKNVSEEITTLYNNNYLRLDLKAYDYKGDEISLVNIDNVTYDTKAFFVSDNPHISFINSKNENDEPYLLSSMTLLRKSITKDDILSYIKNNIVVKSIKGNIHDAINNYGSNEYYTNVSIGNMEKVNIDNENRDVLDIFTSISYLGYDYYINFQDTNDVPYYGLTLKSFSIYNENDLNNGVEQNNLKTISTTLIKDENDNYYSDIIKTPIHVYYYHLVYEINSNNLDYPSGTTYDIYLKNTIISLCESDSSIDNELYYDAEYHAKYMNGLNEILGTGAKIKYSLNGEAPTTTTLMIRDPGTYNISMFVYKEDENNIEVNIGELNNIVEIKKKTITDLNIKYYINNEATYTGDNISSFLTLPGYKELDYIDITYIYDENEQTVPYKFISIGQYEITLKFSIKEGYQDYYILSDSEKTYSYTFTIKEPEAAPNKKAVGYLRFRYKNSGIIIKCSELNNNNIWLVDGDDLILEFYIEDANGAEIKMKKIWLLEVYYKKDSTFNSFILNDKVSITSSDFDSSQELSSTYYPWINDGYSLGYYDENNNYVTYNATGKTQYKYTYNVYRSFNELAAVSFNDNSSTTLKQIIYNNVRYYTYYIDATVDYSEDGYNFTVGNNFYKPNGDIIIYFDIMSFDYLENSSNIKENGAITVFGSDSSGGTIYNISSDNLSFGEYYIIIPNSDTLNTNAYYIAIHLTIN